MLPAISCSGSVCWKPTRSTASFTFWTLKPVNSRSDSIAHPGGDELRLGSGMISALSAQQRAFLIAANCEVAFDNLTRQLYATDASIYQIEPLAVAFPKSERQASAIIEAAAHAGVSIIPRGAGTGLVGGAIGEGLVIDFSRYNREITELDLERRAVRVGPGVVLDQLNHFLRPHGFCFGPDVATSSRATLGGMIANNSSGAHSPVYGTTGQHRSELEIVLVDGRIVPLGPGP